MSTLRSKPAAASGSDIDKDTFALHTETGGGDTKDNPDEKANHSEANNCEVTIQVNEDKFTKQHIEDSRIQITSGILEHQKNYENDKSEIQDDSAEDLEQSDEQSEKSEKGDEMRIHENILPYQTDIV